MAIDQAAMIRTIYDTIFSAYTQPPLPGLPPISQPSTTFLTLLPYLCRIRRIAIG